MSKPVELTLLAAETFGPGDYGVVTNAGVVHIYEGDRPEAGALIVMALEMIEPMQHGRFEEAGTVQPADQKA
jgi:hypothetical protein